MDRTVHYLVAGGGIHSHDTALSGRWVSDPAKVTCPTCLAYLKRGDNDG